MLGVNYKNYKTLINKLKSIDSYQGIDKLQT